MIKTRFAKVMCNKASDSYQEVLKEYIEKTEGDILEIGCSQSSTGFILDIINGTDRQLTSLTGIVGDYNMYNLIYPQSDNHKWLYNFEDYDALFDNILNSKKHYSIIFVNSFPWVTRKKALEKLNKICDYMIIHDAQLLIKSRFINPSFYFEELEMFLPSNCVIDDIYNSTLICHKQKKYENKLYTYKINKYG